MPTIFSSEPRPRAPITINTPATLFAVGMAALDVSVRGISEQEMALLLPTALVPGQNCMIAMPLPGDGHLPRVNSWGTVIHCHAVEGGYRIGVRFIDMDARSRDCIRCLALGLSGCRHACRQKMSMS